MGISNSVMPIKGNIIEGKHGSYELGDELGHGGNGTVFDVRVVRRKDDFIRDGQEIVIKILTISRIKNKRRKEERRERFRREVKAVCKASDLGLDVLPIIDSYTEVDNYSCEWYVMPKAKEYRYSRSRNGLEVIKQLRQMGITLSRLHGIGLFHRDIKPANILFYKNRCFLTDFGLVRDAEEDYHITGENEAVGPVGIRPPEMENHVEKLNVEIDYQKVDVYLYAKTVWILLTGNRNGFRGEYNRAEKMIYMNREQLSLGKTIEPLHKMMEGATRYNNAERITIDECLDCIDQQIAIAENTISEKILSTLLYEENVSEIKSQMYSDATLFNKSYKIDFALSKMANTVEVVVEEFEESISLGLLYRAECIKEDIYKLSLRNCSQLVGKKNLKLYVRITEMNINNDDNNSRIKIDKYSTYIDGVSDLYCIKDFSRNIDTDIGLNGKYNIILKKVGL